MSKFYRRGGYIGGICEGLGDLFGMPSIIFRIIFLFGNFPSVLVYLIIWIFTKRIKSNEFE